MFDSWYAKEGLLIEAVNIINDLHIKEQNQDTQGDIYEYLLSELQTSGKNGQFRTPRHIIKMMVEVGKPEFSDRILDPACGTGEFLIRAIDVLLKISKAKVKREFPAKTAVDSPNFL